MSEELMEVERVCRLGLCDKAGPDRGVEQQKCISSRLWRL